MAGVAACGYLSYKDFQEKKETLERMHKRERARQQKDDEKRKAINKDREDRLIPQKTQTQTQEEVNSKPDGDSPGQPLEPSLTTDEKLQRGLQAIKEMIQEDLELLGTVDVDCGDGLLRTQDFCRLFKLINKYIIMSVPIVHSKVLERREALRNQDEERYRQLVIEIRFLEEHVSKEIGDLVKEHF